VPAEGGVEERVTRRGADFLALESPDGGQLLYKRHAGKSTLVSLSLPGGAERPLVDCASDRVGVGIRDGRVFYAGCEEEPALHVFDPRSRRDRTLGKLEGFLPELLSVSPDGATVLYARSVNRGSDLKLIENFR
jgi:hypothetical protein